MGVFCLCGTYRIGEERSDFRTKGQGDHMTASHTPGVIDWQQLNMFGQEVVEIRLTVGVVASSDHCQFQVEAWRLPEGQLIAMVSIPHRNLEYARVGLSEAIERLRELVHEYTGPF